MIAETHGTGWHLFILLSRLNYIQAPKELELGEGTLPRS